MWVKGWKQCVITHTFTITNNGDVDATSMNEVSLTGTIFTLPGGYPGLVGPTACGSTLASGASCDLRVQFAPTATGTQNEDVVISYHNGVTNGGSPTSVTRQIQATGVTPANLAVQGPATVDFGTVTIGVTPSPTITLTVENTGTLAATTVDSTSLTGGFDFVGGSFPGGGTRKHARLFGGHCLDGDRER